MKKFVIRAMMFALLVVGLVGGACALEIAAEIWFYRHRELVAPKGATVFVCGDSKTALGLDPKYWPELFNFSHNGRLLDQTYLTALDVVRANPGQFETVIVDVAPEGAYVDYGLPLGKIGASEAFCLLYLLHPQQRVRCLDGLLGVARDVMVKDRLHLISRMLRGKRKFQSSLASGHWDSDSAWKVTHPERFDMTVRRWCGWTQPMFADLTKLEGYFKLLDKLVDAMREQGLEVVLLTTPWHPDLIGAVGPDRVRRFTELVGRYAERKGCRYKNMLEMAFPDDCWRDGNHLNVKDVQTFTETVRGWLCSSGGRHGP